VFGWVLDHQLPVIRSVFDGLYACLEPVTEVSIAELYTGQ